jgi:hypothetical protein
MVLVIVFVMCPSLINDGATEITVSFDPETEHPVEMQQQGWQAILNNFKSYTESL